MLTPNECHVSMHIRSGTTLLTQTVLGFKSTNPRVRQIRICRSTTVMFPPSHCVSQTATGLVLRIPGHASTKTHAGWSQKTRQYSCSLPGRSTFRNKRSLPVTASSARADEPSLVRQTRPSWNYKLGAVYQHLLPGPLLFLPSLLQPVSTIISLEGALHGHQWVHWLISLLPVPQVHSSCIFSWPVDIDSHLPTFVTGVCRWSCNSPS